MTLKHIIISLHNLILRLELISSEHHPKLICVESNHPTDLRVIVFSRHDEDEEEEGRTSFILKEEFNILGNYLLSFRDEKIDATHVCMLHMKMQPGC